MTKINFLICITILFGCNSGSQLKYEDIEWQKVDVPAKTMIARKIVVKEPADSTQLRLLADELYNEALNDEYTFHNPPNQIFIHIYKSAEDNKENGSSWIAEKSINTGDFVSTFHYRKQ